MSAPTVPRRNDPPPGVDVYSRSKAHEISGKDPAFEYQILEARDDRNPGYLGNLQQPQEITDGRGTYALLDAWVPVETKEVDQGRKRADDSKGVTSQVRHGTGVLCKRPIANKQKREYIDGLKADATAESLSMGERKGDRHVSLRGRVAMGTEDVHSIGNAELLEGV